MNFEPPPPLNSLINVHEVLMLIVGKCLHLAAAPGVVHGTPPPESFNHFNSMLDIKSIVKTFKTIS